MAESDHLTSYLEIFLLYILSLNDTYKDILQHWNIYLWLNERIIESDHSTNRKLKRKNFLRTILRIFADIKHSKSIEDIFII